MQLLRAQILRTCQIVTLFADDVRFFTKQVDHAGFLFQFHSLLRKRNNGLPALTCGVSLPG